MAFDPLRSFLPPARILEQYGDRPPDLMTRRYRERPRHVDLLAPYEPVGSVLRIEKRPMRLQRPRPPATRAQRNRAG